MLLKKIPKYLEKFPMDTLDESSKYPQEKFTLRRKYVKKFPNGFLEETRNYFPEEFPNNVRNSEVMYGGIF